MRVSRIACCNTENGREIQELPDGTLIGLPLDEQSEIGPLSKTLAPGQGNQQAIAAHAPELVQAQCGASPHAPQASELFGPGVYFFKYAEGLYYNVSGGLAPLLPHPLKKQQDEQDVEPAIKVQALLEG